MTCFWYFKLVAACSFLVYLHSIGKLSFELSLWSVAVSTALCMLFEYRMGAKPVEVAKLSRFWRGFVRVVEVLVMISGRAWLVGVVTVLLGGQWFDSLVFGGLGGILLGFVGVGIVLAKNRQVGFYSNLEEDRVADGASVPRPPLRVVGDVEVVAEESGLWGIDPLRDRSVRGRPGRNARLPE